MGVFSQVSQNPGFHLAQCLSVLEPCLLPSVCVLPVLTGCHSQERHSENGESRGAAELELCSLTGG